MYVHHVVHSCDVINVVRFEFLRRFVRLVASRKHEVRSTVRKNLLKGKIVTSHVYIYTKKEYMIKIYLVN
jgi:hypothetical protein